MIFGFNRIYESGNGVSNFNSEQYAPQSDWAITEKFNKHLDKVNDYRNENGEIRLLLNETLV